MRSIGRTRRRGFTLIEMMISLLISTLVVIMILSIFARMSFSYREQQQIVALQQSLAAARNALENDAKQAGLAISQGFTIARDLGAVRRSPVWVVNNASGTGPDEVGFYYADTSTQALVVSGATSAAVTVDNSTGFIAGDLVVMSTADTVSFANPISIDDAKIARFSACVTQIENVSGNVITFSQVAPWGMSLNTHCALPVANMTMLYKFVAHYWRINTTDPTLAPLQMSATGNLLATSTFEDQAYGFSDLQISTLFYDGDGTDAGPPDGDPARDWYSSTGQTTFTAPTLLANTYVPPLMMTISIVDRTNATVEGVFTASTPSFTNATYPANNPTGDRAAITLPSATDAMLMGQRIYRFVTFQVDLRNMGVGR